MGKNARKDVEVFRAEGVEVKMPAFKMKVDVSVTVNPRDIEAFVVEVTSVAVRALLVQALQSLLKRIEK